MKTKRKVSIGLILFTFLSILIIVLPLVLSKPEIISNEVNWETIKNILQGVGSSMLATILCYIFYNLRMEELVAQTNVEIAREIISERFTSIIPEKIYEDSNVPSKQFNFDFNEKFANSNLYYYKGPTGKTTSLRIYKLNKTKKIPSETTINLIVLNPTTDNIVFEELAKRRIRNEYDKKKCNIQKEKYKKQIDNEVLKLKTDVFFTLYILYSISHEVESNVYFSDSMPLSYIQSMSEGLFISFEIDKDLPQTYFYNKAATIHKAYNEELKFICKKCKNSIHFNNAMTSVDFIAKLEELNFKKLILDNSIIENINFESNSNKWIDNFERAMIKRQTMFLK